MSDNEISVSDVVRLFVDKAKIKEELKIGGKLIKDFTMMSDEEIAEWFIDYGLVMSGRLNTDIMQIIDPTAKFNQKTFNRPDAELIEMAYDYFMERVEDSVTDNDYMDDNWDGFIGNPNERGGMYESKKYSSFKNQQTITENFRKYVNESSSESEIEETIKEIGLKGQEAKGYTSFLKRIIAQEDKERYIQYVKARMPKGDRMAPPEWNEGWMMALEDAEEWSKGDKKQSLMNWLKEEPDPYSQYDEGLSQKTMTENFRRFLKEDDWKDGNTDRAGKYLDTSYEHSLGGLDYDDFIIKPEILAQYMMNRKEKANFAAKIAEIAKDKLGLGKETRNSEGPKVFTWPKKHKEATLKALERKLDGDKYAIAETIIANL